MVERCAEVKTATESIEDINPEDLEEEQELRYQDYRKVIDAGIWLMRNGYGHMALLPYIAPSGCYWRCEFHQTGKPSAPFFRYSSSSEGKYLNDNGGDVRRKVTPKGLARAILRRTSADLLKACEGDLSPDMGAWLVQLERALDNRWIPAAFDNSGDAPSPSKWNLVGMLGVPDSLIDAPPGYVVPGA